MGGTCFFSFQAGIAKRAESRRRRPYLPRWGRLAGVQIQIQVLHLFVSLWLHHRTAAPVRRHGGGELHVLRQRKCWLRDGGGGGALMQHSSWLL